VDFCENEGLVWGAGSSSMIPTRLCENARCGRAFHVGCLQNWLHSLPDTRLSIDTLFGACPYCTQGISVKAFGAVIMDTGS
jgi:E3 ubiquitin-protein ligase FANCL